MHLHETFELPADVHRVARLLADPTLTEAVARRVGALDEDVEVVGSPDAGFVVTSRLGLPTDGVPGALRGMVGARIEVRQVERWPSAAGDGARTATVAIEFPGAPVRVSGSVTLTPTGPDASRVVYDGDVRASVPLFGSMVEQAAAGALRQALEAQRAELHERATQP